MRPPSVERLVSQDMTPPVPLLPESADPPAIRCKTCKATLPDTTRKNCATCRSNKTESYNRWKNFASLRSIGGIDLNLSEFLLRLHQLSSFLLRTVGSSTLAQPSGPPAPLDPHSNEPSHYGDPLAGSRLANDQPRQTSTSTVPQPQAAETIEYQRSDELIDALLALPPRSRYIGMFSIVADPTVNNSTRAHLFAGQLHARAVPISCVSPSPPLSFSQPR